MIHGLPPVVMLASAQTLTPLATKQTREVAVIEEKRWLTATPGKVRVAQVSLPRAKEEHYRCANESASRC